MSSLSVINRKICVEVPYAHVALCQSIPGGKWNKLLKRWEYTYSPITIWNILNVFRGKVQFQCAPSITNDMNAVFANLMKAWAVHDGQPAPVPYSYKTKPWQHQETSHQFLSHVLNVNYAKQSNSFNRGGYAALDMGCGKSKVAIDFINTFGFEKVLIVSPAKVVRVWAKEDGQFNLHCAKPYRILQLDNGSVKKKQERADQFLNTVNGDIQAVAINYESLWREPFASWVLKKQWDCIILDEIHRIKTYNGQAAKFCHKLGERADVKLGLSGTPMPHGPMDVFSQLKFTDPGLFGLSYSRFRSRYAFMGGFQGKQILGYINQDEMTEKLKQVMIRIRAEDVLKLTNFEDIYFTFDLSAGERKIYNEIQNEFCTQLASGMITVSNALTKLLRLQQITCGHLEGHIIGDTKKSVLMDFLMDIAPDENIVVFCLFHQDLNAIQDACKQLGIPCAELSGRKDELDIWQKGHARVLAAQIRSGKEGIDLTRARYNIYYSEGFSLGDYSQSRKRTDRPGQTRDGYYIHLIAEKTVDEKIIKALRNKQDIVENVLWQFKQD